MTRASNKGMKLTKLSAAPTLAPQAALRPEVPPHARAAGMDAGTASQLIPGVRQTHGGHGQKATSNVRCLATASYRDFAVLDANRGARLRCQSERPNDHWLPAGASRNREFVALQRLVLPTDGGK